MTKIEKFESDLNKPRDKWTKAEWRYVAETLAKPNKLNRKVGRKKLDMYQVDNTPAAEFWVQQEQLYKSIKIKNRFHQECAPDVYSVEKRKFELNRTVAIQNVIKDACPRATEGKTLKGTVQKKAKSLARLIQIEKKYPKKIKA